MVATATCNSLLYEIPKLPNHCPPTGGYIRNKNLSLRILAGVWCLMAVSFVASYTGDLTAYLTAPQFSPIPNSFDELANSNNARITLQENTILAQQILAWINYGQSMMVGLPINVHQQCLIFLECKIRILSFFGRFFTRQPEIFDENC